MSGVSIDFLSNHWLHSSPVSIFRTDSTPLTYAKTENIPPHESATSMSELGLLLSSSCKITVFLNFLSNCWPHSSPISIIQTKSTPLGTDKGQKQWIVRIEDSNLESLLHERNLPSWIPGSRRMMSCCTFHIDDSIFNAQHVWFNKVPIICRQCRKFREICFVTTNSAHRNFTRTPEIIKP
jgi:hypothetical protein